MNRPWIWNLLLLALLIGTAVRLPSSLSLPRTPLPEPPEIRRVPRVYPEAAPAPLPEGYGEIVDRNLFSPLRGKVDPAPKAAPPAPKPVPPPKATLFGVVIEEGGEPYAYMSGAGGQETKPKKYRQGDAFSTARVKEIRPDRVILTVGASEHTVTLRTPKEGAALSRPAPPTSVPRPGRSVRQAPVRPRPTVRQRRGVPRSPARQPRPPVRRRVSPQQTEGDYYDEPGGGDEGFYEEEEYEDFFDGEEEEYYEEEEEPW